MVATFGQHLSQPTLLGEEPNLIGLHPGAILSPHSVYMHFSLSSFGGRCDRPCSSPVNPNTLLVR